MTVLKFRIGLRFNEVDGVIKRTSSVTGTISIHDEWGPLLPVIELVLCEVIQKQLTP